MKESFHENGYGKTKRAGDIAVDDDKILLTPGLT
jgi:hypothetical protein